LRIGTAKQRFLGIVISNTGSDRPWLPQILIPRPFTKPSSNHWYSFLKTFLRLILGWASKRSDARMVLLFEDLSPGWYDNDWPLQTYWYTKALPWTDQCRDGRSNWYNSPSHDCSTWTSPALFGLLWSVSRSLRAWATE
jgi:hypothetical protein